MDDYICPFFCHVHQGKQLVCPVCFPGHWPFKNGIYFYREEFAPTGANSYLQELIPLIKETTSASHAGANARLQLLLENSKSKRDITM